MSFFKSNKTNTTATENNATEETTNNGGGLLTTFAIAGGTILGITAAVVGGTKAYKKFHHSDDEIIDSSDDDLDEDFEDDDDFIEVPVDETPVENFNEVETEETNESAPVDADEAKTEETNNETPAEDEKPSATSLVNQLEKEASVFEKEMVLPFEVKTAIEQMDFLMGRIAQCHRTIGDNAHIEVAVRKLQNGVKDFWLDIDSKLIMHTNELDSLGVIEDLYGSDIDMIDRAYFDMKYINKSNLVLGAKDAALQMFHRLVRIADKMSKKTDTKHVGETQTTAFDVFKDGHKETNKVEGETKTSTKKVTGETKNVTKSGKKQTKTKASKTVDVINQFAETTCEELVKSSLKSLGSLDYILNVNDQKPCEWLHEVAKYVDSNIGCLLKTNHKTEAYKLINIASRDIENAIFEIKDYMIAVISAASTIEELDDAKESVAALSDSVKLTNIKIGQASLNRINDVKTSLNNMYAQLKSAGETKTSTKKVIGETKTVTKESPSETQIGNSTVISDDGETVTLKASVSEESIQNVKDVIGIVSRIPNREHPELNDMAYFTRVIGERIHGITEPEATFVAYDEASNSNKFMDACVEICTMIGEGICNLANSDNDPVSSMAWINRCSDELVASGIIDNTYNPSKYKAAILKARDEVTDVLSKRVTPEIMSKHNRGAKKEVSNENQVDATKVTGETKTVTNGKLIDEINTYVHEINIMAFKDFTMVSTDSFIEKLHKIDECISLLDNSEPSKAIKRNAYENINITVRLFCTSKLGDIDACTDRNDIAELCADVRAMLSLNLTNVELNDTTLNAINNAITSAKDKKDKVDEIVAKNETQDLAEASDETQADVKSSDETQAEDTLTFTMSEKIKEVVQQSDETAATAEPETESQAPMSPEASSLALKLQEVGELMRAKKWSDASEFYKTQLTPYLADDGLSKELREEIMSIKTKATNMLMSQKQLDAKQKAASAKASKKGGKKRRRH